MLFRSERASLQAQLALLAAQLTEIADAEDDAPAPSSLVSSTVQPAHPQTSLPPQTQAPASHPPPQPQPPTHSQPAPPKTVELPPPPIAAYSGAHLVLDVNAFPEVFLPPPPGMGSGAQTEVDEGGEDSDEDEDMEDVVVPVPMHHAPAAQSALRT